jgi:hypothetical protein
LSFRLEGEVRLKPMSPLPVAKTFHLLALYRLLLGVEAVVFLSSAQGLGVGTC